jgi:transcription initiation factor TFIIIB Brf1 subunit/transcription initiation factor TFIIB
MSDFDLFNSTLNAYNTNTYNTTTNKKEENSLAIVHPDPVSEEDELSEFETLNMTGNITREYEEENDGQKCDHLDVSIEKGVEICITCGEEITKKIQNCKEWRYYGSQSDVKNTNPNRVQIRKLDDRGIFKDVENMGFSDKIVCEANKIYFEVTKGQIFRGNSRKAIVFASIFHAYKLSGKPQSHDKLIQVFNLNRKNGLKGLKHINLYAPKTSTIRTTYITPVNLIEEIMDKFSATPEQKQEVVAIYNQIKNKSSRLNRSRPQSVACGLIFYWIKTQQKDITIKQFTKKVNLSELTINKIASEIEEVIKNENISV